MVTYDDFLAHVVNLTSQHKYVCFMPGKQLSAQTKQQIDAQVQTHTDRLGRFYSFFLNQGLAGADLGVLDLVKDYLIGVGATNGSSADAVSRLADYLGHVDFIAVQFGMMGARFLAAVNGDALSVASLPAVAESLNGIGNALLELQGVWKVKLAGFQIGKGIGMDLHGTAMFTFTNRRKREELRSSLDQLQLGTSAAEDLKRTLKMAILNPWLFGHKGRVYLSRLIFRLFDGSVENPGFWRSLTATIPVVDRFNYGFTPADLLPSPR